jgi:DNA-binding NarL/FixJ family response regulator
MVLLFFFFHHKFAPCSPLTSSIMALKDFMINHIIFCEDDADDKEFFGDVLQQYNPRIKVEHVSNGIRLMENLHHFAPDILFLDLEMPYKNGLECLVEIRENRRLENLPVVVFSSTTKPSNIQTAYEMGAHLFLIKSSSFTEYAASIQAVLDLDWTKPNAIREQYCINGRYAAFS